MKENKDYETAYQEIKIIGKGSFGTATLVQSRNDKTFYVSKKINLNNLDEKAKNHALLEVDLLKTLNHPNIVGYKDSYIVNNNNLLIIIMEYCEEGDLDFHILKKKKKNENFPEKLLLNWIIEIMLALDYIHDKKILHRDIKCSNIFLTSNNTVKLGDFGISKVLENSNEIAMTFVGTPYFMSPEICQNKPYDYKSDVWALGCVIYELCSLKHVFDSKNILTLITKIIKEEPDAIPSIYSQELQNLIKKTLEKDYHQRPSIKDLFKVEIIRKTLKEFAETKGTNIKEFKLLNNYEQPEKKEMNETFQNKDDFSNSKIGMGVTVLSEDFNESMNKASLNKNTNFLTFQKKKVENHNFTLDKTVQSMNISIGEKNLVPKTTYETLYEDIPIIEQSAEHEQSELINTHFTISAGMPHRMLIKQLAQKHREQEKEKKRISNEKEEYPNDFEEDEKNNEGYDLFQALQEKKERNLKDLLKLCENQLQTKELKIEEVKESFVRSDSTSPTKKSFKMKKGNYITNFSERIENFKTNIITKIGKSNFNSIYDYIKKLLNNGVSEEKIYDQCSEEFTYKEEIYLNIKRIIDLEEGMKDPQNK